MRPSFSSVMVGYQRPCAVGATSMNVSVEGSKTEAFGRPVNGMSAWGPTHASASELLVPPLIRTLPSCMTDIPLQNMSQLVGIVVMLSLVKSSSAAPCKYCGPCGQCACCGGQLPEPERMRILLVWRSAA